MTIWDGEYAFSIQAAFRSDSIALSHPVIRFQLALFWSTNLRSPIWRRLPTIARSASAPAQIVHHAKQTVAGSLRFRC
jgi:hypothetical protein